MNSQHQVPVDTAEASATPAESSADPPLDDPADDRVNYDGPPLVELEVDGVDYRLDVGKQGTALCISTRGSGSWRWSFAGEARWDGGTLRSKAFDRRLLDKLAPALVEAVTELE